MEKNEEIAQEICVEVWERGCLSNQRIRDILNRAYQPAEAGKPQCKWTYIEDEGYYDTECGKAFQLSNEHSLTSNNFRFCCYCGAALTEAGEEEK